MKLQRSQLTKASILLVVGAVLAGGFLFTEVFQTHASNESNRIALLKIRDTVSVGSSHAEVLDSYWRHRTDYLKLHVERPTDWIITMPLEFGAGNWKLLIEFHDGRVSAVRIRTADGPPVHGPKDKEKSIG